MNSVSIIGNLTRDVEMKSLPNGSTMFKGGLAESEKYKNKAGEVVENTNFFDFIMWGEHWSGVAQYMPKGQKIAITGSLKQERWETPEGDKRSKISIVVSKIDLLSTKEQ